MCIRDRSGSMSGDGKRSVAEWPKLPRPSSTLPSKSAASRRFVALSADRLAEWMSLDLSKLDLLVIQIDGLHIGDDLVLVAALGIDGDGHKHPLGPVSYTHLRAHETR